MNVEIDHGHEVLGLTYAWMRHLSDGDFTALWGMCHPEFRMVLAQAWITNNPALLESPELEGWSRDEVVGGIVGGIDDVPHTAGLRSWVLREFPKQVEFSDWGVSTTVRTISPGVEATVVVDRSGLGHDGGVSVIPPGGAYAAVPVFFYVDGDASVLGFGGLLAPGWPPVLVDVDISAY